MHEQKSIELYKRFSDFLESKNIEVSPYFHFSALEVAHLCCGFNETIKKELHQYGFGDKTLDFTNNLNVIESEKDVTDFLRYVRNIISEEVSYAKGIKKIVDLDLGGIVN